MPFKLSAILPLFLAVPLSALAADKPPALQKTDTGVTAAPQSLADRAKTMRVKKSVFEDFNPPQVLYDPAPTPPPGSAPASSSPASRPPSDGSLRQPRRVDAFHESVYAQQNAAAVQACPKSTEAQKQAANERLQKANQAFESAKAQRPK